MAWYHTYFEGLPQKAWKLNQDDEYTEYEVDFLRDTLDLKEGSKVLDVMAGYGRHALPLADQGMELTCVDLSKEYCKELKKISVQEDLPVHVLCDDILSVSFEAESFDAAYCFGNSFSFFPREDMQKFLQKISDLLVPGGQFAIHTENLAESIFPNYQVRNWMPVQGDIIYLAQNEYHPEEGFIESEQTFISGTEKITHTVRQHIYTLAELNFMFQSAGLKVVGAFGNLEADPFQLGDEQLYMLARKI